MSSLTTGIVMIVGIVASIIIVLLLLAPRSPLAPSRPSVCQSASTIHATNEYVDRDIFSRLAIGIIPSSIRPSVRPSVCLSVTLCVVALRVGDSVYVVKFDTYRKLQRMRCYDQCHSVAPEAADRSRRQIGLY